MLHSVNGKKLLWMITWEGCGSRHGAFQDILSEFVLMSEENYRNPLVKHPPGREWNLTHLKYRAGCSLLNRFIFFLYSSLIKLLAVACFPSMSSCNIQHFFLYNIYLANYVPLHVTVIILYSYSSHHLFDDCYDPVLHYPISSSFPRDSSLQRHRWGRGVVWAPWAAESKGRQNLCTFLPFTSLYKQETKPWQQLLWHSYPSLGHNLGRDVRVSKCTWLEPHKADKIWVPLLSYWP